MRSTPPVIVAVLLLTLGVALPAPASPEEGQDNPRERGFAADKAYQAADLDAIDLATGNVVVSIPVGPTFAVNGGLSYALHLVNNSDLWDFRENGQTVCEETVDGVVLQYLCPTLRAEPDARSNAGLGWVLSLGELIDPDDDERSFDLEGWTYISPDGARHTLKGPLHRDETAASAGEAYTHDGSYLRMKLVVPPDGPPQRTIEAPDGTTRVFEGYASFKWRLTEIRDPFGNHVTVTYLTPSEEPVQCLDNPEFTAWTIQDNTTVDGVAQGRAHQVCFAADGTIDHVTLNLGAGAAEATYSFEYFAPTSIMRSCEDNDPTSTPSLNVTFLKQVNLPDGSRYAMWSSSPATPDYFTSCHPGGGGDPSGAVRKVTLPTGGAVTWAFQDWSFASRTRARMPADCSPEPATCWDITNELWSGVHQRMLKGPDDEDLGTWTYTTWFGWRDAAKFPDPEMGRAYEERRTIVTDPAGNDAVHYLRALPRGMDTLYEVDGGFPEIWDHALPYTRRDPAGNSRRTVGPFLSVEHYDGAAVNAIPSPANGRTKGDPGSPDSANKVRSVLVDYAHDQIDPEQDEQYRHYNRHQTRTRTVYHDDADHWTQVDHSSFDGLGHFRTSVTTSSFPGAASHTSFVGFNPPESPPRPAESQYPTYDGEHPDTDTYVPWPYSRP